MVIIVFPQNIHYKILDNCLLFLFALYRKQFVDELLLFLLLLQKVLGKFLSQGRRGFGF